MANQSIENISSLNSKVQAATSDKIVFNYGIKLIDKILTDTSLKEIIQKIQEEGNFLKKEAVRLYKIIDIRLDEIIQEIKNYCKENQIDLDRYFYIPNEEIELIIKEIINKGALEKKEIERLRKIIKDEDFDKMKAYCLDNNIHIDKLFVDNPKKLNKLNNNYFYKKISVISEVLSFILRQSQKHLPFVQTFFDVDINYSLGNFLEKELSVEYLNKSFWEIISYAKLQYRKNNKFSIPLFSDTHINFFKSLQDNNDINQRRKDIIRSILHSFLDKGEEHCSFISKYTEIIPEFNLFNFKELKQEFSLYEEEIEKIKDTMETKVWYNLDILIWLSRAYYEGDSFIEKKY